MAVKVHAQGIESDLIPGIDGITRTVRGHLETSELKATFEKILCHFTIDERGEPNVEDLLTHVRSLRSVAGKEQVRGLTAGELNNLDDEICAVIVNVVNKSLPDSDTSYRKVAAWIGAIPRTHPIEVFTPNYDLLMEQALEESRVPYFDGFVGSRRAFFDPYAMEEDALPPRWARLWKLHGSINWSQDRKGVVSRGGDLKGIGGYVIHPSHLKYDESRQMPYLAMIDRLRAFLKRPFAVLVVCGYSFRDDHLNANMLQGLQGNATAVIFALLHGELANYGTAAKLASSRANLSLLAEDRAVIGTKEAPWRQMAAEEIGLASLVVESVKQTHSESEFHEARFTLGDFVRFGSFLGQLIEVEDRKEED